MDAMRRDQRQRCIQQQAEHMWAKKEVAKMKTSGHRKWGNGSQRVMGEMLLLCGRMFDYVRPINMWVLEMGRWLAEGYGRDATALWKDVRFLSERHLRYTNNNHSNSNARSPPHPRPTLPCPDAATEFAPMVSRIFSEQDRARGPGGEDHRGVRQSLIFFSLRPINSGLLFSAGNSLLMYCG